jgi:hypothetical protein
MESYHLVFALCSNSIHHGNSIQHRSWYAKNYEEIKLLNPNFPFLLRTTDNAMPAVTTELEWTTNHVAKFMIQTGRFRNTNGTIAEDRVEAAKAYLATDWEKMAILRWKSPGFDPERPGLDVEEPDWKDDSQRMAALSPYLAMKAAMLEQESIMKSGPDEEFTRSENALLMCQRVDLWCAGPAEVERAVQHLYKLARACNEREVDFPSFITEFLPGSDDMQDN